VGAVADAVRRASAGQEAFEIEIDGGGAFPNPRRPRTLWMGVTEGTGELATLAAAVNGELVAAGWPADERPFRAHLTLARSDGIPAGADVARRLAEGAAGLRVRSLADRLVLFESITGRGPAHYEPLQTAPLRLRPAPPAR
jgi:RNA 2',3'-cyclic 3'-phosphodiesterase